MMLQLEKKCLKFRDNRPVAVISEKQKEIRFINEERKKVSNYHIDGCLIKDGMRCDFLFLVEDDKNAFFIELKGSELKKAIQQIDHSINPIICHLAGYRVSARVIIGHVRSPQVGSIYELKLKKRLKELKGDLKIQESGKEEKI